MMRAHSRPLIVDANAVIVRCIMASVYDDHTARHYTGGLHGSLSILADLLCRKDANVDQIVAFFDDEPPEERKAMLPGYKAGRDLEERLPEGALEPAFEQIQQAYKLWPLLGVRCLTYRHREADDGVAAAVRVFARQGHRSVVLTSDADLYQCVAMGGDVWDMKGRWVTPETFEELTTVPMHLYVAYRALVGDTSDNIKGAKGCGKKRSAELLAECHFGTQVDPHEQLTRLAKRLHYRQGKRPQYVIAVVDDEARLHNVIRGIDLSDSFGGTKGLTRALSEYVPFQSLKFLKQCMKLGLRSVAADPERFLRPFREARERLDTRLRS